MRDRTDRWNVCGRAGMGARRVHLVLLVVLVAMGVVQREADAQCRNWVDRTTSVGGPFPGSDTPVLTFDSARGKTVALFGFDSGINGIAPVYEYDGASWVRKTPPAHLDGPRYGFSLAYMASKNASVMFGGQIGIGGAAMGTNTLALWNGNAWQVVPPSGLWPPATFDARSTYDPIRGKLIVILSDPIAARMWQTWEWSDSGWSKGPSFGPVSGSPMSIVFDTRRNRGFVYTTDYTNDVEQTWELTPGPTAAQGAWNKITISGSPFIGRTGSNLAYDPFRGRILRFGGKGIGSLYGYVNALWWWNFVDRRWELQSDFPTRPGDRAGAGLTYDTARDRLVMCAGVRVYTDNQGVGRTQHYTDTWEFYDNAPGFLNVPTPATVDGGSTAIFAATTSGELTGLQWLHDNVPVPGATSPILVINNASTQSAGFYWLRATNDCGFTDSAAALLTVRPPSNDIYLSPRSILTTVTTGTTLGATNDGTTTCGTSNTSADVWLTYTAPNTGNLTFDTCGSDFDTVLSVNTCCSGQGSVITCNDDVPAPAPAGCGERTSSISFAVTQGQRFLVRIAGYLGAQGNYTLNTRLVPFNNNCSSATEVSAGSYAGTTVGASVDGFTTCGTGSNTTPDIWYRFRSDCSGTITFDTFGSSYDTVLSAHNGCVTSTIVCNDDAMPSVRYSSISFGVVPGGDYRIRVSGFQGAIGSVVLNVSPPVPTGDDCATAGMVGLGETTIGTRCARTSSLAVAPWCSGAPGAVPFNDRWFRYVASQPGILELRLCNTTFTPLLAVYSSLCPTSAYNTIACASAEDSCGNDPLAAIPTLPGDELLIRVGGTYGLNALTGGATLELILTPFELGACCSSASGCTLTNAYQCVGTFQGEGTACSPAACPTFAGACCQGNLCSVLSASGCAGVSGVFRGFGTVCTAGSASFAACCRADFDRSGNANLDDIFIYLNAWFARDPRCDVDGVEGLTLDDLFVFLNIWFAGCS